MSEAEISAYIPAKEWDEDSGSYAVQADRTGEAAPLFTIGEDGEADTTMGGGAIAAPLEWGEHEKADDVKGWQTVTDLDGAGGHVIPGCLQAAYWQGRLWLRLLTSYPGSPAEDEQPDFAPAQPGEDGSGCIGTAAESGLGTDAATLAATPALYICPQEARDGFLRADGAWRTDIRWEVLGNYSYTPSAEMPGWDIRVTLWVIPVGNVLCFYTTASPRYNDDFTRASAGLRAPYSAFGQRFPQEGRLAETPGVREFCSARLPWQEEEAKTLSAEEATTRPLPHGTAGIVGTAGADSLSLGHPAGWVPLPWFCPRWHIDAPCGLAWEWTFWSGYNTPARPQEGVFFAARKTKGWEDWCAQAVSADKVMAREGAAMLETAQHDYRFDPWLVEGAGLGMGYTAGFYAAGQELWPPVATDYVVTARAALQAPLGKLYLVLGGAAADGTLLTASAFAEPYEWTLPPDSPIIIPDPPNIVPPEPEPDPDPDDPDPDPDDPDPDPEDPEEPEKDTYLPEGRYYMEGEGVRISARRHIDRSVSGQACDIWWEFDITGRESYLCYGKFEYTMPLALATANGDSYTYHGREVQMYHGFTAETYPTGLGIEVIWASSHLYADTAPKNALAIVRTDGEATLVAKWETDALVTSEERIISNILRVYDTGRYYGGSRGIRIAPHLRRKFRIYRVVLKKAALKNILRARAAAAYNTTPNLTPQSITAGGNSNIAPPTVAANAWHATAACKDGQLDPELPTEVTGILRPTLAADYDTAWNAVHIHGGGEWHYSSPASEETPASASFNSNAVFKLTLPAISKDNL